MRAAGPDTVLDLGDPHAVEDLRVFLSRARAIEDGAVRLQAVGSVLAAYVLVMGPRALGEPVPTVLGLRTAGLATPAQADVTVTMASVFDRLARLGASGTELELPPAQTRAPWAAVTPPRGPWIPEGEVDAEAVRAAAAAGIAEVVGAVPDQPGAAVVQGVRAAVWGRDLGPCPALPAGAAFAAHMLGFITPGEDLQRFSCGPWSRLSSSRGHVLCRRAPVLQGG
ncbi:hypothetical protein [Sinomonas soli]